jgi:hypothetical protein
MKPDVDVFWVDRGFEPTGKPDPRYPLGIDIDLSAGAERSCKVALSYPAPRIGHYVVRCRRCGLQVALTTAGRVDDPRSVRLRCDAH